eukprot:gene24717-10657_t
MVLVDGKTWESRPGGRAGKRKENKAAQSLSGNFLIQEGFGGKPLEAESFGLH